MWRCAGCAEAGRGARRRERRRKKRIMALACYFAAE
jgi:hypothetical protein